MTAFTTRTRRAVLLTWLALLGAHALLEERLRQVRAEPERGDVPGWAIASGAACVLGLIVYTAYNSVITKWTGKIK